MAKETILDTDNLPIGKNKINANFDEIYGGNFASLLTTEEIYTLLTTTQFIDVYRPIEGFKIQLQSKALTDDREIFLPNEDGVIATKEWVQKEKGWAYYVDSLTTPTITITTSYKQITIDALGSNITDYLPREIRGVSELWAGNKITPISIGDDYDGRLDVTVNSRSGSPNFIEVIIDISNVAPGDNIAFTGYIQTGGSVPYNQSLPIDFFSLSTFLSNGGKMYARTDAGSATIGRRNIKISRKYKGDPTII